MTASYFYLLGQALHALSLSSTGSLVLCVVVMLAAWFSSDVWAVFLGWGSAILLVHSRLARAVPLSFAPKHHYYVLLHFLEMTFFALTTCFVLVNDYQPLAWLLLSFVHVIFLLAVHFVNTRLQRVHILDDEFNYYTVYGFILVITDLLCMMYAAIADRFIPYWFLVVLAVFSCVGSAMIRRHPSLSFSSAEFSFF